MHEWKRAWKHNFHQTLTHTNFKGIVSHYKGWLPTDWRQMPPSAGVDTGGSTYTSINRHLAEQPALAPSLQPRNFDLIYIWLQSLAKNLFVGWKRRVPLASPCSLAVYLVRGNIVGVVAIKWVWPNFLCALRTQLFTLAPLLSWGPGSAPEVVNEQWAWWTADKFACTLKPTHWGSLCRAFNFPGILQWRKKILIFWIGGYKNSAREVRGNF